MMPNQKKKTEKKEGAYRKSGDRQGEKGLHG